MNRFSLIFTLTLLFSVAQGLLPARATHHTARAMETTAAQRDHAQRLPLPVHALACDTLIMPNGDRVPIQFIRLSETELFFCDCGATGDCSRAIPRNLGTEVKLANGISIPLALSPANPPAPVVVQLGWEKQRAPRTYSDPLSGMALFSILISPIPWLITEIFPLMIAFVAFAAGLALLSLRWFKKHPDREAKGELLAKVALILAIFLEAMLLILLLLFFI